MGTLLTLLAITILPGFFWYFVLKETLNNTGEILSEKKEDIN